MTETTDKPWLVNGAQYKAQKMARDLRAGVAVICDTPKIAYSAVKSLRIYALSDEEMSCLEIKAQPGTFRRVLRLVNPEKNSEETS